MLLLVRARAVAVDEQSRANTTFAKLVERTPDAVVVTDSSGRILSANPAFLNLCGVSREAECRGKPLADWVGRDNDDLPEILRIVRLRGIAPRISASLTAAHGRKAEIEITATLLEEQDQECVGFTMRTMQAGADRLDSIRDLATAVETVMQRVGHDPLPQLMSESAGVFERFVIAHAIERSNGDRRCAAELLGVTPAHFDLRVQHHGLVPDKPQS